MRYIASVSFGKDSLAMLLRLIEENKPLDEVVFYDTGMEFEAIYKIRDKVKKLLKQKGIKYTELKPKNTMEFDMFDKCIKCRNGSCKKGYGWCGGVCRWGTTFKIQTMNNYIKQYKEDVFEYIGIAVDEPKRLEKERKGNKLFPLAEWRMTEKDCLQYCYDKGYNWLEDGIDLYSILDRVSCWCCANKNLKELKNYYLYLPKYWQKLKDLQSRTDRPFKNNRYTIFDLEEKFKLALTHQHEDKGE